REHGADLAGEEADRAAVGLPVEVGQAALEVPATQLAGERGDLVRVAAREDVGHLAVARGPLLGQRDTAVLQALEHALDLFLREQIGRASCSERVRSSGTP